MSRHDIVDEKLAIIGPMLAKASAETKGRKRKDDRLMLYAILRIMKTEALWRDLHPEFRRGKGGLTTKVHAVVDALGNPVRIHLIAGNVNDIAPACDLYVFAFNVVLHHHKRDQQ